jgi:hypothetical protein
LQELRKYEMMKAKMDGESNEQKEQKNDRPRIGFKP